MKAYKGFRSDLTCDPTGLAPYQYEEGGTYETEAAVPCQSGFHACPAPLSVLTYYSPAKQSVYHEVEVDDDAVVQGDKVASKHLRVGAKLTIAGLIEAQIGLVLDRASKEGPTSGYVSTAATSGDGSTAATSGDGSTAATSGARSAAATSGARSTAATSGDGSTAATSGYGSTAAVTGAESVAVAAGLSCTASGADGCWLVLVERDTDCHILDVKAVKVAGDIKAGVAYQLVDGQVVQA